MAAQNRTDSDFGRVLRYNVSRLLIVRGWESADLYDAAGISRSYYSHCFKAENGPGLPVVKKLADALGVHWTELLKRPPEELLGGEDQP